MGCAALVLPVCKSPFMLDLLCVVVAGLVTLIMLLDFELGVWIIIPFFLCYGLIDGAFMTSNFIKASPEQANTKETVRLPSCHLRMCWPHKYSSKRRPPVICRHAPCWASCYVATSTNQISIKSPCWVLLSWTPLDTYISLCHCFAAQRGCLVRRARFWILCMCDAYLVRFEQYRERSLHLSEVFTSLLAAGWQKKWLQDRQGEVLPIMRGGIGIVR